MNSTVNDHLNHEDLLRRLQAILSLLADSDYPSSIAQISLDFCLPVNLIRDDICHLTQSGSPLHPHFAVIPSSSPISEFTYPERMLSDFLKVRSRNKKIGKDLMNEQYLLDIANGFYDHFIYKIDPSIITFTKANEMELLPLSMYEYAHMIEEYPSFPSPRSVGYMLKRTPQNVSSDTLDICNKIMIAIQNHDSLSFQYSNPSTKKITSVTVTPTQLYHDTSTNLIYIITRDSIFRTDRIRGAIHSVHINKQAYAEFPDEMIPYLWEPCIPDSTPELIHVKLKIYAETKNIINKIRMDTARRTTAKIEPNEDGSIYYYTDTILRSSAFESWVRSFGASVIVQEPRWLAEKIYESAKRRLANYETGTFNY